MLRMLRLLFKPPEEEQAGEIEGGRKGKAACACAIPAPLLGIVAVTVSIWAVSRGCGGLSGLEGGLNRLGELCRLEAVRAIRRDAESVARKARL
ncbi:MAG: hypothetical protein FRX49_05943 [Trebouxia sp. A1-2]|nr:MAG: hypothetical protein FRX49_05943 [Trebouxia sp. A1-2]